MLKWMWSWFCPNSPHKDWLDTDKNRQLGSIKNSIFQAKRGAWAWVYCEMPAESLAQAFYFHKIVTIDTQREDF